MIPVLLRLENFLPYRTGELDLTGVRVACLTGHNGAGKSSLFDAITWALWGQARDGKRKEEELVYHNQTEMQVRFEFELSGRRYMVLRKRSLGRTSRLMLDLQMQDLDSPRWLSLSEATSRATQDKIDQLLRMDYQTFIHSAFLQQGRADAFTLKTPAERKKLLYDILGLAQWERYEIRAKERVRALDVEVQVLTREIEYLDSELQRQPAFEAELAEAEQAVNSLAERLAVAESALADVGDARQRVLQAQRERDNLLAQQRQETVELDALVREIERLHNLADVTERATELARVEAQLAEHELLSIEQDDLNKQLMTLDAERAERVGENNMLKVEGEKLNKRIEHLETTTEALCPTCGQPLSVQQRQDLLAELMQERDAHRTQFGANRDRVQVLSDIKTQHQQTLRKIEVELKNQKALQMRLSDLKTAIARAEDAQQQLQNEQTKHQRRSQVLADLAQRLSAIEAQIATDQTLVQAAEDKERTVQELRIAHQMAQQRLGAARQQLVALKNQQLKREEKYSERQKVQAERGLFDELRLAFGKQGVPAMIIEAAVPEIETHANMLLSRMTKGQMSLSFETQRETAQGDVRETLDIKIADQLGTRSYEMYSGGEAFRINFAIRVALSKLLARRAGAQLQTLLIDEGFGTQDAQGREHLVDAINAIQDDFERILVITHVEDLKESFPVRIEVRKTPDGSVFELV